ncbi:hypothetical protein AX14_002931 [Amanita brunnescens Koide BX004]|nr:hypothetical protein AX14_002931 [Amanita brunnescens Koide BX004]
MSITPLLRALPRYRERCYHDFNPAVMANIMEPVAVMNGSMRLVSFSDVEGIERNSAVSDNTFALFSSYALSRLPPVICANLSGCFLMATLTIKRRGLQVRWGSGVCRKGEREAGTYLLHVIVTDISSCELECDYTGIHKGGAGQALGSRETLKFNDCVNREGLEGTLI